MAREVRRWVLPATVQLALVLRADAVGWLMLLVEFFPCRVVGNPLTKMEVRVGEFGVGGWTFVIVTAFETQCFMQLAGSAWNKQRCILGAGPLSYTGGREVDLALFLHNAIHTNWGYLCNMHSVH